MIEFSVCVIALKPYKTDRTEKAHDQGSYRPQFYNSHSFRNLQFPPILIKFRSNSVSENLKVISVCSYHKIYEFGILNV